MENKPLLVTSALPYANGLLHIGHILEFIQTDIYVRFMKLLNTNVVYIGGADMHGTPIELKAKDAGEKPRTFALKFYKKQKEDLDSFLINFDNYYHTDTPENQELAEFFYTNLKKKGYITREKMTVVYCESCARSLPDRYVKGTCPHCGENDQYGDICEKCNTVLKGVDLIEPYCVLCTKKPIQKEREHYFFTLKKFSKKLEQWMDNPESGLQPEIKNWLRGWIKTGLDDWCISRDAPYYGFEIPDSEKETGDKKYFYVWLDAPIGYISSTKKWCDKNGKDWKDYWYKGNVQHFIGKDIVYFHYLFWPAMFMGMGIPIPKLLTHGFVNVNGTKMSKSRGTFFTAEDFLKLYPAESLRFYYALHLDTKVSDIDLQFDDFKSVINNVLMGNVGNFCYRTLTFAEKNYDSLDECAIEGALVKKMNDLTEKTKEYYRTFDFKSAVKHILQIADIGNAYFQNAEPWKNKETSAAQVNFCVNIARNVSILIQPVLPEFATKVQHALSEKNLLWKDIGFTWKGSVGKVPLLVEKVENVPGRDLIVENIKDVNVEYSVSSSVQDLGVKVRVAQITGLKIKKKHERIEKLKKELQKNMKLFEKQIILEEYTKIDKKTVVDPIKHPNSVINLINLIKEKGKLPQINTVVDLYNIISVKSCISMATHDLSKVEGKINVRLSEEDEHFLSLDGTSEKLKSGEVIYADRKKIIGRFSKQCKQTITTDDSTNVALVAFGNSKITDTKMDEAMIKGCELIVKYNGGSYKVLNESGNVFPLQMKVGKIIDVKNHPDADKLYVLQVDFKDEKRQVVAGLREHFFQKDLMGMKAVFCVNLAKAKIRGELSEAMIMVAEDTGKLELLGVGSAPIGDIVQFECHSPSPKEVSFNEFLKLTLRVKDGNVMFGDAKMKTSKWYVSVKGVKDGSTIC